MADTIRALFKSSRLGRAIILTIIVTTVEVYGLFLWLGLQLQGAILSAGWVLFGFLLIEHIISQIDHNSTEVILHPERPKQKFDLTQFVEIVIFSTIEVVVWIVWLSLIPINNLLAIAFFTLALFVEHQITDNVKKRLPLGHFASPRSILFRGLVIFTISEVAGAVIWVSLVLKNPTSVGYDKLVLLLPMIIGSLLEHYIAGNVGHIRNKS